MINFRKNVDHVRMFDSLLAEPDVNSVIDLQSDLLDRFFTIFDDIGFAEGARDAGIGVAAFFILDRFRTSLYAASRVRDRLGDADFVLVRNDAIGSLNEAREGLPHIGSTRELVLPELSRLAMEWIEQPGFSFAGLLGGGDSGLPADIRYEVWDFVEKLYEQRRPGADGSTLLI